MALGFGAYWFGPWHLFVSRTVDESLPGATTPAVVLAADEPGDGVAPGGGATPAWRRSPLLCEAAAVSSADGELDGEPRARAGFALRADRTTEGFDDPLRER